MNDSSLLHRHCNLQTYGFHFLENKYPRKGPKAANNPVSLTSCQTGRTGMEMARRTCTNTLPAWIGNLRPLLKGETLKTCLGDIFEQRPGGHFQNSSNNCVGFQTVLKT